MNTQRLDRLKKAFIYATKTLLGGLICWYGLSFLGVDDPIWAVITVIIVSDADIRATLNSAMARTINTTVGCAVGMTTMLLFGYSPQAGLVAAGFTVFAILLIDKYPSNWRLAPATVVILMDAGRLAADYHQGIIYALLRFAEIIVGCAVAIALAWVYSRIFAHESQALDLGSQD